MPNENENNDNSVENLTARLEQLLASVEGFTAAIQPFIERQEAIKKEKSAKYEEYLAFAQELNAENLKIEEEMFEARKAIQRAKQDALSMERQIAQEQARLAAIKAAEEAEAKYKAIADSWDKATMAAPWREWLKDHQVDGARKITGAQRIICADGMGLGKTAQAIAALDMIRAATTNARMDNPWTSLNTKGANPNVYRPCGLKVIYFCPATMLRNVEREIRRWAPHRSVVILGKQSKVAREFLLDGLMNLDQYVVIVNYEAWRKQLVLLDKLIGLGFDTAIVDEAHNIKDRKSVGYKGIQRVLKESNGHDGIEFVLPMTGTPILNKPQELFSLLTLVDSYHFYDEKFFLQDYCQQNLYTGKWEFKTGGLDSLAKRISNIYFRRTKDQAGIKLPPKTIIVHDVNIDEELYPNQARARTEMRTWGSIIIDKEKGKAISAAAMIAIYTRLRQIETWPAGIEIKDPFTKEVILKLDVEESQKIDYILERLKFDNETKQYAEPEGIITEWWDEERTVIFSQFKAPLHELKNRIEASGKKAVVLDGDTPTHLRDEIMMNFDTSVGEVPKWDVVLCNYKVGGVGVTMTAATQMIILDEEWNPGKRDQAYDRIHRIGQDKPVTIHVLRSRKENADGKGNDGGIDSWLAAIIEHKESVVDGFNSATDLVSEGVAAFKSGLI